MMNTDRIREKNRVRNNRRRDQAAKKEVNFSKDEIQKLVNKNIPVVNLDPTLEMPFF